MGKNLVIYHHEILHTPPPPSHKLLIYKSNITGYIDYHDEKAILQTSSQVSAKCTSTPSLISCGRSSKSFLKNKMAAYKCCSVRNVAKTKAKIAFSNFVKMLARSSLTVKYYDNFLLMVQIKITNICCLLFCSTLS